MENAIRLVGRVDEDGHLDIPQAVNLPPGEVIITVQAVTPEMLAADDALWDKKFARTQPLLEAMAARALKALDEGTTDDLTFICV